MRDGLNFTTSQFHVDFYYFLIISKLFKMELIKEEKVEEVDCFSFIIRQTEHWGGEFRPVLS